MANKWFAVRTKSHREAVVSEAVMGKGYEVLCPSYQAGLRKGCSAGGEPVFGKKPLFPGYVFCRFNILHRLPILTVPGVMNIVSIGKVPVPLDEDEIQSLKVLVDSKLPINPYAYLKVGDLVTITDGPLRGVQGFIKVNDFSMLVVSITLLQRSLAVRVDGQWLERHSQTRIPRASAA